MTARLKSKQRQRFIIVTVTALFKRLHTQPISLQFNHTLSLYSTPTTVSYPKTLSRCLLLSWFPGEFKLISKHRKTSWNDVNRDEVSKLSTVITSSLWEESKWIKGESALFFRSESPFLFCLFVCFLYRVTKWRDTSNLLVDNWKFG